MKNFKSIFTKGKKRLFQKKDIIISPTLLPEGVYYLEEGFVYGYTLNKKNKKRIQNILKPGEIFPILQSTIEQPSRFYVEALTDVTLSLLARDTFLKHIYANKNLTEEYLNALISYISRYSGRVENLELETLREKVAGRIIHFGVHFGIIQGTKIFIEVPLTQKFIADSINVSRENVSRELKKLVKEQLIAFDGKHIVVLDSKKLGKKI
jgi:CRP-like cAMP-binding protein